MQGKSNSITGKNGTKTSEIGVNVYCHLKAKVI